MQNENTAVKKTSIRKITSMLGFGALCVGTICAIGILGLGSESSEDKSAINYAVGSPVTTTVTTTAPAMPEAIEPEDKQISATVSWWKAQVDEYDFIEVDDSIATTTTTTTKKTTTTAKKTTAAKKETKPETTTVKKLEPGEYVIPCTDEEFEMFCYVLEGEAGGCSDAAKMAVAGVIVNRVQADRFDNTIKKVLTAPNQFTAIKKYYNKSVTPSQSTINCVKRALAGEDGSNGAYYFYSKKYCSDKTAAWFESLVFCIEIDGQRFFRV